MQGRGATAKTPLRPGRLGPTSHLRSLSLSPERSGALPRTEERELVIMTLGPSAGADGNAVALRRVPHWIAPPDTLERSLPRSDEAGDLAQKCLVVRYSGQLSGCLPPRKGPIVT